MSKLPLTLALVLATLAPLPGARQKALDHESLARTWMQKNGIEEDQLSGLEIERVIEEHFVHFPLGLFDLRVAPSALADADAAAQLSAVFQSLIELQRAWIEWAPTGGNKKSGVPKELKADLKALTTWIAKWKPEELAQKSPAAGKSLVEALAPKEKVETAAASFATYMRAAGADDAASERPPAQLILIPDRGEFLEFVCFAGLAKPHLQPVYWAWDLAHWTNFDYEGIRTVTFEFDAQNPADYAEGLSMNFKNPHGLEQQISQIAGRSLLDSYFGEALDPMLAAGLANNLVVDLFDEVDTRTDGDLSARRTNAHSAFVPGGMSEGGTLPAINADSRWRKEKGRGYFVDQLQAAQAVGGKKAQRREKHRAFELQSRDGSGRTVVQAPFLGSSSIDRLDEAYLADFADFLRAYRTAFLYWLRTQAAGKRGSPEKFAQLLDGLAGSSDLSARLQEVYGQPISTPEADGDSLEGQFLIWLAKQ